MSVTSTMDVLQPAMWAIAYSAICFHLQMPGVLGLTSPAPEDTGNGTSLSPEVGETRMSYKVVIVVLCLLGSILLSVIMFLCALGKHVLHLCPNSCQFEVKDVSKTHADPEQGNAAVSTVSTVGSPEVREVMGQRSEDNSFIAPIDHQEYFRSYEDVSDLINAADVLTSGVTPKGSQNSSKKQKHKKQKIKKIRGKSKASSHRKKFEMGNTLHTLSNMMVEVPPKDVGNDVLQNADSVESMGSLGSLSMGSQASLSMASLGSLPGIRPASDDLAGVENEDFFFSVDMENSEGQDQSQNHDQGYSQDHDHSQEYRDQSQGHMDQGQGQGDQDHSEQEEQASSSVTISSNPDLQSHVVSDKPISKRKLSQTLETSVIMRMLMKKPGNKTKRLYQKNPSATLGQSTHKAAQKWAALQAAYDELFKEDMTSLKMT